MKITTIWTMVGALLVGLAFMVVGSIGKAQDGKGTTKPQEEPGTKNVEKTAVPVAEFPVDAGFDRYFNRKLLTRAWADLNAELLADIALELAEGERILLRQHRGISAEEMMIVAARVAVVQEDDATLQRLNKAAIARGDKQWQTRLEALVKLAAAYRETKVAQTVSIDKLSPAQFGKHHELLHALKHAAIAGDRKALEAIQEQLNSAHLLNKDQKERIQQRIDSEHATMPVTPDKNVAAALSKLTAATRSLNYYYLTWNNTYFTVNGNPQINVVNITLMGNNGSFRSREKIIWSIS